MKAVKPVMEAMKLRYLAAVLSVIILGFSVGAGDSYGRTDVLMVENFEGYAEGNPPERWEYFARRNRGFIPLEEVMGKNQRFFIVREGRNTFVRGYTKSEAQRISLENGQPGFDWSLDKHTKLGWEWRANKLPPGAREDKVNDVGAAVYVTFDRKDWLGRPHSLKYTYSSTLPVGTVVESGNVKVIVVSSGADGIGKWITVERNVAEDYRKLFRSAPPKRPFSITLWSDSDDTRSEAEADFDNIRLLP